MNKFTSIAKISLIVSLFFAPIFLQAKTKAKSGSSKSSSKTNSNPYIAPDFYSNVTQSEFKHEIFASGSVGQLTTGGGVTSIAITGMYGYVIQPKIEAVGSVDISNYSYKGVSRSGTGLFAYGFYNFDENLRNSFFAAAGLGTVNIGNEQGSIDSKFGLRVGGGKRLALWNNVALTPYGWLQKIGSNDMQIVLVPINLSLFY